MNFSSHIIINAPAEAVWDIIGRQFDRIGEWATAIPASAAVPQDAPGEPTAAPVAGRVCDTGIRMLPQATEMIIAYSDRDRTLTYQATGMPAYVGGRATTGPSPQWTSSGPGPPSRRSLPPAGSSAACWPGGSWSRSAAPAGTSWGT
jgi:Polyketide cyclase / dehydrase and lipid transport